VVETPATSGVTGALRALLDDVLPMPAYVFSPPFDLLAWNRAYSALYTDPACWPESSRNLVWMYFMDPSILGRVIDCEEAQRSLVGRFRSQSAKYPGIERFQSLVDDLLQTSSEFREAWNLHEVGRFLSRVEEVAHPLGKISVETILLRPVDPPSLFLMLHRPTDDTSGELLRELVYGSRP
jgi:hypothetical protein